MATEPVLPSFDRSRIDAARATLADQGIRVLAGTVVNMAGITLAKNVAPDRLGVFATSGLGASPTWNVFCIDGGIAFTPNLGVVGDMRLRLDVDALVPLHGGLGWAPTELFDQSGEPLPIDPRGRLRRITVEIEQEGLGVLVGHELEFVLTSADGTAYPRAGWIPYGLGPVVDHEGFAADLLVEAAAAGLPLEQLHAEYVPAQFEISLPPAAPLAAADGVVLARLLIGRIARRHGLRASFSPLPFAGGGGNGAHIHFSLTRGGQPLFSGGPGPYGITDEGVGAIGGVVAALPGVQAVLGGSILSGARLRPGFWSGAYPCWGRENREAAVRFVEATPGNPHGANVEVKPVDPSANPYLSSAAVLGTALDGIRAAADLPAEVTRNPADLAGMAPLPSDLATALEALESSAAAPRVLGAEIVQAVLAVRRWELDHYGETPADELPDLFRFAWSI